MLVPIPKTFLIHSATHRTGKMQDDWGNETWETEQVLKNVRFEPSDKLIMTKDNAEAQLSAVMYFDCRNSGPSAAKFSLGDEIERDGTKYTVVGGTKPVYAGKRAHHYEVELV